MSGEKSKVRLLGLVVSATLILLTIGAMLVVLGIFNETLNWDIFSPGLEAVLYGVFGSCMALAAFGVAMSVILAMQESVRDFKAFVQSRTSQTEVPDAPRSAYAARMLLVLAAMGVIVSVCALVNHVVLTKRCAVFKRLAAEQLGNFSPRIVGIVDSFEAPPQANVPRDLYDIVRTLDDLDVVRQTTLYIPDPVEPSAMWGYTAWRTSYTNSDGFARFYVAKDFEKAMRKAIDGDTADLDRINDRNEFTWFGRLAGNDGRVWAVLRLDGDSHQSFREYR